jgi:hypothetical protein
MSGVARQRNIGAFIIPVTSVDVQSSGAATINGSAIQLAAHGYPQSAVVHQRVGALSGTPSTTSVVTKVQTSADGSTNWTDYTDPDTGVVAATPAVTAATLGSRINVDLSNALEWIRLVTTIAFTGGSSPAALVYASAIFGGEPNNPAV